MDPNDQNPTGSADDQGSPMGGTDQGQEQPSEPSPDAGTEGTGEISPPPPATEGGSETPPIDTPDQGGQQTS